MNHSNETNNFGGNVEESENNQSNQGTNDLGIAPGTLTDAVAGAMIGAQFGLIGTVIGGVSGGVIGNQMVETADADEPPASNHRDLKNE